MKLTSRVKIRACRMNGALSRGPVTEAGKRRSSQNGLTHGLYSRQVLLPNESREDFDALVQEYIQALEPRNHVELDLVRLMAIARWRGQRIAATETRMMNEKLARNSHIWDEIVPESAIFDEDEELTRERTQTVDAFSVLAENRHFALLSGHGYRQFSVFLKAHQRFLALRRGLPEPAKLKFSIPNPLDDFFTDRAK